MPNIIIEVSHENIITKPDNLLARINDTLWKSGNFKQQSDIKSRLYNPNNVLLGMTNSSNDQFIVVHFYLMPGRDNDTIKSLAQRIANAIKSHLQELENQIATGKLQICVNPIELSANYVKQII